MLKFLGIFFFLWISCNSETVYSSKVKIENNLLQDSQHIDFSWNIKDTSGKYNLILSIKHNQDLVSRNFYVKCISKAPDHKTSEQLVSLELLDNSGIPFGDCHFDDCDLKIILASNIYFPLVGNYSLTIFPFSRIAPFPGIKEIGLSIDQTKFR